MSQLEPEKSRPRCGFSWTTLALAFLLAILIAALVTAPLASAKSEDCLAPPSLPVSLHIVYHGDSMLQGGNFVMYSGTASYTFSNDWPFPVTLAFPPLSHYTWTCTPTAFGIPPFFYYRSKTTWQDSPFPDNQGSLPEFAQKQREVVIPAGQSVTFTSPFNVSCTDGGLPRSNHAFVFGMPRSPCKHPVLGTIYAKSVDYTGTARDVRSTKQPSGA